jgi:DNA invertase Pin-like site-specific DNA recombinase
MKKFVIYYRVSTRKQGESGLGLEAQHRDVGLFFESYTNEPYEVIAEFTDIESGTNDQRIEFNKAVALAKKHKATLLVAKLDRISRKVSTIALLMEQINFKVASMPNADKFQLHIYAALAEQERDFISKRTKAALASAKARGIKLGGNRGNIDKVNLAASEKAKSNAESYRVHIETVISSGVVTYKGIADRLNEMGVKTNRGGGFQAVQVSRLCEKLLLK